MEKVNVIIPAYNEETRLPGTLEKYLEYFSNNSNFSFGWASDKNAKYLLRLIVVSDGSIDNTVINTIKYLKEQHINGAVIGHKKNKGKGYTIRKGLLFDNTADYYYLADADMSAGWGVLNNFLIIMETQKSDVVIASRATKDAHVKTLWYKKIFGRGASLLINALLHLNIKDTQCGYKLFNNSCYSAFNKFRINDWGFDFELLYLLKKSSKKIIEKGIEWQHVPASNVSFGAYFKTIIDLVKVRFGKM